MSTRPSQRPNAEVAHDLSNLLTVIAAQADRMLRALPLDADLARAAAAIEEALARAGALTRELAGPLPVPADAAQPPPTLAGAAGRVLLAEGERQVRQVVAAMLRNLGFDVVQCASAAEALEQLAALDGPLRLAVLDLSLADLATGRLLQRLREIRPGLPAVLLSGEPGAPVEHLLDDRTVLLDKPFRAIELSGAVARLQPAGEPAP